MNCRCGITVCRYTGFAHIHSICKLNMLRDMRKFLVSPFDVVGTFIYDILYQKDSISPYASTSQRCLERFPHTETEKSSFWWNVHHWLHWKLSKWQLPVQPVMKISSNDDIFVSVSLHALYEGISIAEPLWYFLFLTWINFWTNHRFACDFRCHWSDVTVMIVLIHMA